MAFPVFFFAVMALCCLFLYMETRVEVQKSMLEVSRSISAYGDLIEAAALKAENAGPAGSITAELLEGASAEMLLHKQIDRYPVAVNSIKGGTDGLSLNGSEIMTSDRCIKLVCRYRLKNPVAMFGIGEPEVIQQSTYRYFSGRKVLCLLEEAEEKEETEENEETVYMTESGTVYHVSLSCPSLKLNISEIMFSQVSASRNENGGKYYACEKCASGAAPEKVFITTDGDRYHYRLNCSGLKRTIREVKRSGIGNTRPCRRCGGHEN